MPAARTCAQARSPQATARGSELSAQMRQLEQVVQIVDRMPERADFTKLLLGVFQVLLNFFELRKTFLDVLIELHLHLLRDRHQLRIHAIANRVEALRSLLIQALKFVLRSE